MPDKTADQRSDTESTVQTPHTHCVTCFAARFIAKSLKNLTRTGSSSSERGIAILFFPLRLKACSKVWRASGESAFGPRPRSRLEILDSSARIREYFTHLGAVAAVHAVQCPDSATVQFLFESRTIIRKRREFKPRLADGVLYVAALVVANMKVADVCEQCFDGNGADLSTGGITEGNFSL